LNSGLKKVGDTAVVHFDFIKDEVDEGVFVFAEGVDDEVGSDVDLEEEISFGNFVVCFILSHGFILTEGLAGSIQVAIADEELGGFGHEKNDVFLKKIG
jgi:hypothetical protein